MDTKKLNAYEAPEMETITIEFEGTIAATTCLSADGETGIPCTTDEGIG